MSHFKPVVPTPASPCHAHRTSCCTGVGRSQSSWHSASYLGKQLCLFGCTLLGPVNAGNREGKSWQIRRLFHSLDNLRANAQLFKGTHGLGEPPSNGKQRGNTFCGPKPVCFFEHNHLTKDQPPIMMKWVKWELIQSKKHVKNGKSLHGCVRSKFIYVYGIVALKLNQTNLRFTRFHIEKGQW